MSTPLPGHPLGWIYHREQRPPHQPPMPAMLAALDRLGQHCGAHPQCRKWVRVHLSTPPHQPPRTGRSR
ncbi:MAG TPA: hypothetical protein VNN62_02305 [Methylomirabilota bacterium]|jgi:hypothetical protein|nr:hypothetical protein [Methylomirabilota bacterium]